MANTEYIVNTDVIINDAAHPAGSKVALDDATAAPLLDSGAIQPAPPEKPQVPAKEPEPVASVPGYKVRRPLILFGQPAEKGAIVQLSAFDAAPLLVTGQIAEA